MSNLAPLGLDSPAPQDEVSDGPDAPEVLESATAALPDHLEPYVPTGESGALGRVLEAALDKAIGPLAPGGHVDLSTLTNIGPAFGLMGASVKMTADHGFDLSLSGRGGPGVGVQQEMASGVALATAGGAVTLRYSSRAELLNALSALTQSGLRLAAGNNPVAQLALGQLCDANAAERTRAAGEHVSRSELVAEVDGLGVADLLPVEARGTLSGRGDLSYDERTGEVVQRSRVDATGIGELALQAHLHGVLVKGSTDAVGASLGGSLAIETRYDATPELMTQLQRGELSPTDLVQRLAGARLRGTFLVGTVQVGVMGTQIAATRVMPLSEVAGRSLAALDFFDPSKAEYRVESFHTGQLTVAGGLGGVGLKLVASKTQPVFAADHVAERDLPDVVRQAQQALMADARQPW